MIWDDDRRAAALLADAGGAGPATVPVVFSLGGDGLDLELALSPAATVADVVAALAGGPVGPGTGLVVDGRPLSPGTPAGEAGLRPGSVLELGTAPPPPAGPAPAAVAEPGAGPRPAAGPAPAAVVELRVVGGLHAGARWPLPPGRWRLGRSPGGAAGEGSGAGSRARSATEAAARLGGAAGAAAAAGAGAEAGGPAGAGVGAPAGAELVLAAPTLSALHLEVAVDAAGVVAVVDLGSHNGTRVDGRFLTGSTPLDPGQLVEAGAVQLALGPAPILPARPAAGAFNRPPRPAPPAPPEPLAVPEQPADPHHRSGLAWAATLAPMAMGAVMALVWDPRMALFALFTPVMMLGTWWEDRRRARKEGRRSAAALAAEVDRFRVAVEAAAADAVARLRAALPDPAEVVARVAGGGTRLWERRPAHPDFLLLRAGAGPVPWQPPLRERGRRAPQAVAVLAGHRTLTAAPVALDLAPGRTVGVVGEREAVEAFLRSLVVQAATLHGPADLRIAVLTQPDRVESWRWAKWLPHTHGAGEAAGTRLLSGGEADLAAVLGALAAMGPPPGTGAGAGLPGGGVAGRPSGPARLVVVDADGLTEGRPAPVRALLGGATGPVSGIVVAADPSRLPALCTTVVELRGTDGEASVSEPATNRRIEAVLVGGLAGAEATDASRLLAGVDDPEVAEAGASLPDHVGLLGLLGVEPTAEAVLSRWEGAGPRPRLRAPVGVTENGPLVVDLVADGPHGLVGGTTGSGKSELLRTLVASLAATASPEHLTFVLIDYKGGSAFDACARLPHTVGLVTDLDHHLGQRALRCLEAELRHREARLREVGAVDLVDFARKAPAGARPLPRLVVVIDEFATLAAELPDFIDALVAVAQRGRSLGVHLVLATQRPAGAVKDNIRANTNLRIALRMQDAAESRDVIDDGAAAAIGRRQAGRGYARLGPSELVAFQAALVSSRSGVGGVPPVELRPYPFGPEPAGAHAAADPHPAGGAGGPTDLDRLVEAMSEAARRLGLPAPRRPWPDPLPDQVALEDLEPAPAPAAPGQAPAAVLGLADDPAGQRQVPARWEGAAGNLLLYGVAGSGTTTALATLAWSLARRHGPEDLHVYVLDFGPGDLVALAELPHVGAVVTAHQTDRQLRLLRQLRAELDRRRQARARGGGAPARPDPAVVLVVDNWAAFAAAFDDGGPLCPREEIGRLVADGPALGLYVAITADHATAVPLAIANLVTAKLVFRLGDRHEYSSFGLTGASAARPGRAVEVATGLEVQIARAGPAARAGARAGARTAPAVGVLPAEVAAADLVPAAPPGGAGAGPAAGGNGHGGGPLVVPVGLADASLQTAALVLRAADPASVTGPARSGKSTALCTLAAMAPAGVEVIALVPRPASPLASAAAGVDHLLTTAAELAGRIDPARRQLVLVDDADAVDDPGGVLAALLAAHHPGLHVVAAGRTDALRTAYGHWTRELRRSRLGLALRPEPEDGDLFATTLPRRPQPAPLPGRGYLVVDGTAEVVQVARP